RHARRTLERRLGSPEFAKCRCLGRLVMPERRLRDPRPPLPPNRSPVFGVDQLVTTHASQGALWQVPARRSAWRRVGALTLDMRVVSAQKKGPGLLKDGAL